MNKIIVRNKDLILPELSYKIIGCAYEVFNNIGGGQKEKVYQKALALAFQKESLKYKEQIYYPVTFLQTTIDKSFIDFLVDDKIVVEIKSLNKFTKGHYEQVLRYLATSKLQLALLLTFASNEVRYKRVINFVLVNISD